MARCKHEHCMDYLDHTTETRKNVTEYYKVQCIECGKIVDKFKVVLPKYSDG